MRAENPVPRTARADAHGRLRMPNYQRGVHRKGHAPLILHYTTSVCGCGTSQVI